MTEVWDQARIEQYITQGTEESLTLDYKAADSLARSDGKKAEITKDVSAMANSAGGVIVYGVVEYQDNARKHLPEKINPIDRTQISKEWLDQVISNIQPKIEGLVIHPVQLDTAPNHAVYVVEVPQSHTAHQAKDWRYYKRFNFESVPMADYEIRDVMGRRQHARITLELNMVIRTVTQAPVPDLFPTPSSEKKNTESWKYTTYTLEIGMVNIGKVYAQYVNAFIEIPCALHFQYSLEYQGLLSEALPKINLDEYCIDKRDNTVRDIIKGGGRGPVLQAPEYGPARHVPILPGITHTVNGFPITGDFEKIDWGNRAIRWRTHVDNAPPFSDEIAIKDIKIVDRRNKEDNG